MSTVDSLNPLFVIYKNDLLVSAPDPPANHCSPLLIEHGTTAFQLLLAKVTAVPEFPSTKTALFSNGITLLLPAFNRLLFPSINLRFIFELTKAAIEETLFPIAGQTVAG